MKYLILISVLFSACATSKPEKVPEINAAAIPATQIEILKAKALNLRVINKRQINTRFGNSAQVEQAIFSAMRDSLSRGGISLDPKSANTLELTSADCTDQEENSECLDLTSELKSGRYKLTCGGHSSATMRRGNSTYNSFAGDVNDVYQHAFATIVGCLNKNANEAFFKK